VSLKRTDSTECYRCGRLADGRRFWKEKALRGTRGKKAITEYALLHNYRATKHEKQVFARSQAQDVGGLGDLQASPWFVSGTLGVIWSRKMVKPKGEEEKENKK
jgi:hypothetical protein